jgi:hypothetical protein
MLLDHRAMAPTAYHQMIGHVHAVVAEMRREKRLIWRLIQAFLFGVDGSLYLH